jgi:hypothetical protein
MGMVGIEIETSVVGFLHGREKKKIILSPSNDMLLFDLVVRGRSLFPFCFAVAFCRGLRARGENNNKKFILSSMATKLSG